MENKEFPKVLVTSINAWRDNTGINTLIDFFKCWDSDKVAQIYTRAALPKTTVCNKFFRISEPVVMKSVLKRKLKTGGVVENEVSASNEDSMNLEEENKLYAKKKSKFSGILSFVRELVWKFGKWKTKELDAFIESVDADVLFMPIYPTVYMGRLQKYVMKKTGKPVVSYLADDNYTFKAVSKNPLSLIHRAWLRKYVRYIVKNSEKLLVIAPKQKEEYDRIFGVNSEVLTKGIDFSQFPYEKKELCDPVKMVYTGKLIIGRWKSLAKIAEALGDINKDGTKIELDIYTTDSLTAEQSKALNRNGCQVKGALTLSEVHQVQKQAAILVFVESLDKKFKNAARLSFSTKITDYLKSGKCIFAIGDKEIAPIDYFNRFDSALTATTYGEIGQRLNEISNNPSIIEEYSIKAYECGKKNHNKAELNELLINSITDACKKGENNE